MTILDLFDRLLDHESQAQSFDWRSCCPGTLGFSCRLFYLVL